MKKSMLLAATAATLTLAAPSQLRAQVINNTTIPVIVITLFTPGTVAVPVDPAVATAVVSASETITGNIRGIISPITGVAIPEEIARVVVAMMTSATPEVRAQVHAALSQSGASGTVVNQLMGSLPSLLSNPTPGQLQNALSAFNGLVNNSNAAFLVNPPAEFLAIHAILLQISNAANAVPHP